MQEYVKDFANRIGGRNRGKWRHEDKKEKRSSGAVSDGSWQDCAWRDSWDLRQGCVRKSGRYSGLGIIQEKGVMYTAASGGAAASYEAAALPKEQNDPKLSPARAVCCSHGRPYRTDPLWEK